MIITNVHPRGLASEKKDREKEKQNRKEKGKKNATDKMNMHRTIDIPVTECAE